MNKDYMDFGSLYVYWVLQIDDNSLLNFHIGRSRSCTVVHSYFIFQNFLTYIFIFTVLGVVFSPFFFTKKPIEQNYPHHNYC